MTDKSNIFCSSKSHSCHRDTQPALAACGHFREYFVTSSLHSDAASRLLRAERLFLYHLCLPFSVYHFPLGFPGGSVVKNLPAMQAGALDQQPQEERQRELAEEWGSRVPRSGRSSSPRCVPQITERVGGRQPARSSAKDWCRGPAPREKGRSLTGPPPCSE